MDGDMEWYGVGGVSWRGVYRRTVPEERDQEATCAASEIDGCAQPRSSDDRLATMLHVKHDPRPAIHDSAIFIRGRMGIRGGHPSKDPRPRDGAVGSFRTKKYSRIYLPSFVFCVPSLDVFAVVYSRNGRSRRIPDRHLRAFARGDTYGYRGTNCSGYVFRNS